MTPLVSVVIVTYNPRRSILEWAIDSIEAQTLPKDQFELVIVDNNSDPPLDEAQLRRRRSLEIRLTREPRQGNVFARCKGIVEARSVALLSERLTPHGLALNVDAFQRENASAHLRGDMSWLNELHEVGRRVLESLDKDMALYECFKERLLQ